MGGYFIRKDFVTNPVMTFNTSGIEEYWTNERIKVSQYFQYHVYEYARTVFAKNKLKTVVDIGAGPGTKMKIFFSALAKEVAIVDQVTVKDVSRKVFPESVFYPANLEDSSFDLGKKFDMVVCSDVIEHMENPDSLLAIIKNHVNVNGFVILSTPDRELRWGKENLQSPNKQHVREWSEKELRTYVEHSGFKVISHLHFPLKKLSRFRFMVSRLPFFYKKINHNSWYSNQTLLMKLA